MAGVRSAFFTDEFLEDGSQFLISGVEQVTFQCSLTRMTGRFWWRPIARESLGALASPKTTARE